MVTRQHKQTVGLCIQLHLDKCYYTNGLISTSLRTGESKDTFMYHACPNIWLYSLGASVVAETQKVPVIFHQLLNNPLCLLLYEDKGVVPNQWSEVSASL